LKKTVNFRFSEETLALLASLAERWGLTRTKTIERLIYDAAYENSLSVEREPPAEDGDGG